ncbi:50S ribosomal protein L4 [Candidatus Uhrbacteria bacterium]|nr:50S ribosomal protein L4 [Candidatus Uhrbacteria bacterium]
MPTIAVYNQAGEQTGERELAAAVFGVRAKASVLHQVVVAHAANARRAIAHTKTRGDVRGGGKKPWAQKHTGRARHGSTRSPLWVGGGRTFGPRSNRNFSQKVNANVRRAALRMALSEKAAQQHLVVFEDFAPQGTKTKGAAHVLRIALTKANVGKRAPSALVALPSDRRDTGRAVRNLDRVRTADVAHLNAYDVIRSDVLVTTVSGIDRATALFAPKARSARAA